MTGRSTWIAKHPKLALAAAAPVIHGVLYGLANRFPLFDAAALPLSRVDLAVPLIPATVWIYLSDYGLVLFAYLLCRQTLRFAAAGFTVIAVSVLTQWLGPIEFPRALYPVDPSAGISEAALVLLRLLDAPVSCFPSLHVALTSVAALAIHRAPPAWHPAGFRWLFFVWTAAVAVSTLTIKQHYAIDVVGGVALAAAVDAAATPAVRERVRALCALRRRGHPVWGAAEQAPAGRASE